MGYTTQFSGKFALTPPLKLSQYSLLKKIEENDSREWKGIAKLKDLPAPPAYHCDWAVSEDGDTLSWNGNEKFYDYVEWLQWMIDNFFSKWGVTVDGTVHYQGDEIGDHGKITIKNNVIKKKGCDE
jgi:hypothetical protein